MVNGTILPALNRTRIYTFILNELYAELITTAQFASI